MINYACDSIKMKALNIKNSDLYLDSKLVNILDFDSKKLSAWDVGTKGFCIHYTEYDNHVLYLVLDNLKDFIEVNDGRKYLTMIFSSDASETRRANKVNEVSDDQNLMYENVWEGIKKVIDNGVDDFSKDYGVIMFDSVDDVVGMINISSMTVIIGSVLCKDNCFYPQIHLNYCSYDVKA